MLNEIYCQDCLDGLRSIDNDEIDLIVTSPPYNIGIKGGHAFVFNGYDVYDDTNNQNYDSFILEVLTECHRVLKPTGSMIFNHKVRTVDKEAIHPLKLIFQSPLKLKQEIVWDLHDTHIHNKDRFYPVNEMLYWLVKDKDKTYFNPDFAGYTTVWSVSRANKAKEGSAGHPAPYTLEIPSRCIEALSKPGDIVLDPFMGSGTTAIAALSKLRYFIGFDVSLEYCKMAQERVNNFMKENYDFYCRIPSRP